jgi:hypothetical protein
MLVQVRGLFLEVVVLVVGLETLQEVRLLGIWEESVHGLCFVVLVLFQAENVGFLGVVTEVVFVVVVLVGKMVVCANPTFEQMARHWFYSFGTNPSADSFVHSRARF